MFNIITKKEYFDWLKNGFAVETGHSLKDIQDASILNIFKNLENIDFMKSNFSFFDKFKKNTGEKKIAEMGGGHSRVLKRIKNNVECWNIEPFNGKGNGPTEIKKIKKIKNVKTYLGEFSDDLSENYFDVVFSISVLEHVPRDKLKGVFEDIYRILKKGGRTYHMIDIYLGDEPELDSVSSRLIDTIKDIVKDKFDFVEEPKLDDDLKFKTNYASNSDLAMYSWNLVVPEERKFIKQSVSLKLGLIKK